MSADAFQPDREVKAERGISGGPMSEMLRSALADAVASSVFPLGVSPSDFAAWYASWWPTGNDAKPGTSLMCEWFAEAEAEIHDGRPQSEHTLVVLALVSEMQGDERSD
jgi:hypothetical protein